MTGVDVPSCYDPSAVLAFVLDDKMLAIHIAPDLLCHELNAVVGVLDSQGHAEGARYWLTAHQSDCDEPSAH